MMVRRQTQTPQTPNFANTVAVRDLKGMVSAEPLVLDLGVERPCRWGAYLAKHNIKDILILHIHR